MACPGMAVLPAALAAELMGGEELVVSSKEVLQNTLNDIRGKLDAGFPVTTELIFLEDIKNELKRQLAEVELTIEEDLSMLPDISMAEFNTDFEEILNNAKRIIYMLDNIIISPSIEQIDSVLELMEILEPEIQNEILATKPELPNRAVDTKANVFKERPVKATVVVCMEKLPW
jgi:sugar-specific transcriptional regulator TrmB